MHSFYQYLVNKVRSDTYVFAERNDPLSRPWGRTFYVNSMQLVIGTQRAALIDTGYGYGDLMPLIRRYTDLPVTLLITHDSYDHWRGAYQFDDIYMSKTDWDWIAEIKKEKHIRFEAKIVADGDVFDLGGIKLESILVPGHTAGSMCFLDRKNNNLFTGDAVNKLPYVFSGRTTLTVYRDALVRLRGMTPEHPMIFCGHSLEGFPYQVLLDSITACDEVLSGKGENDPLYGSPHVDEPGKMYPNARMHEVGQVCLCYNPQKLR